MNPLALRGCRILDLSRLLPGPYCTSLLLNMGAEVIKVETPLAGDYLRLAAGRLGFEGMFGALNSRKKSIAVNYRSALGRSVFLTLAERADVVVETFRPGATKRWGIDYDSIQAVNPRVVYCSLSAYGQTGPHRGHVGHDLNLMALSGLLSVSGADAGAGTGLRPLGVPMADLAAGMLAALAIVSALLQRERTGQGAFLDVSLLDAALLWAAPLASDPGGDDMGTLTGGMPCYNVYRASDGRHLSVAALEPHLWAALCKAAGQEGLAERQFDARAVEDVARLFGQKTRDEWLALLQPLNVCVEPVNTVDEARRDPQVAARGALLDLDQPSRPPTLGEHTREILCQAGYADAQIDELAARGIVGPTPRSQRTTP